MRTKIMAALLGLVHVCAIDVWGADVSYYWDGWGPVSERWAGKQEYTFNIGRGFSEIKSVSLSIQSSAVTRGETSVSFNGVSLGELKDVGGDFFDIATTTFDIPVNAIKLPDGDNPIAENKLVVEIKDGYGTLAWITTSPRLVISGVCGLTLTASDGDYTNRVELTWTGGVSGETYTVSRGSMTIAANVGGSSYQDRDAVPGEKYIYRVVGSLTGVPGEDEGFRMPEPPKLGGLLLTGCPASEIESGLDASKRFLVTGHKATAKVDVIGFDRRYYDIVETKLVGTPESVATKSHVVVGIPVFADQDTTLRLGGDLLKGPGYHGVYGWQVEAKAVDKVKGREYALKSSGLSDRVFFDKYASDTGNGIPNWFNYWAEDGACPTLKELRDGRKAGCKLRYKACQSNESKTWGGWNSGMDTVTLTQYTSGRHYSPEKVLTLPTQSHAQPRALTFGGDNIYGVYTVEGVLAHELNHRTTIQNYALKRYQVAKRLLFDSDSMWILAWWWDDWEFGRNGAYLSLDINCDYLIDDDETGLYGFWGMDIGKVDTFGLGDESSSNCKNESYKTYGDNEFTSMLEGDMGYANAIPSRDWACPGENSILPQRVIKARETLKSQDKGILSQNESIYEQAKAYQARTTLQATPQLASFRLSQSASDSGGDEQERKLSSSAETSDGLIAVADLVACAECDAKGLITDISVAVTFTDLPAGHHYLVQGVLVAEDRTHVVIASTEVFVGAVPQEVELKFDGLEIVERGLFGAYRLGMLEVSELAADDVFSRALLGGFEKTLITCEESDFAQRPARALKETVSRVSESGIEVDIPLAVAEVGEYAVSAILSTPDGQHLLAADTNVLAATAGRRACTVVFPGEKLFALGVLGPYELSSVTVRREGEIVSVTRSLPEINVDSLEQFRPEGTMVWIPRDSVSMDYIESDEPEIEIGFAVTNASDHVWTYEFSANLFAADVSLVSNVCGAAEIRPGINRLSLRFNLSEALESGKEGPYWVDRIVLSGRDGAPDVVLKLGLYMTVDKPDAPHPVNPEREHVAGFATNVVTVAEGETLTLSICGGQTNQSSSVQVYLTYLTAAAADIDLKTATVDGVAPKGGLKFPLTLSWAAGEVTNRVIRIPVKTDKTVEGDERLVFQLAAAQGMAVGDVSLCDVTLNDATEAATLQDGAMSQAVKLSSKATKDAPAWLAGRGNVSDPDGTLGLYHAESPTLASGVSSELTVAVTRTYDLHFRLRFSGPAEEETPSTLAVYDGKRLLGVIGHGVVPQADWEFSVSNEWDSIDISLGGGNATIRLVFTQGSDPTVHAELSDFWCDQGLGRTLYRVKALNAAPEGGYVTGSGLYADGSTASLKAKANPGWVFRHWLLVDDDESTSVWSVKETVSLKVTDAIRVTAVFDRIPYVAGLADPADGGKVTGSGYCATGKKVTLKAKANKNFTFVGWYAAAGGASGGLGETALPDEPVSRLASLVIDRSAKPAKSDAKQFVITNASESVTYYARFVSDPEVFVTVTATDGKGDALTGKGAGKYIAGTITGMGKYAKDKKVTLKATANKGYVFSGWWPGDVSGDGGQGLAALPVGEPVSRLASYVLTMPTNDVAYVAKFVTADEDKANIVASVNGMAFGAGSGGEGAAVTKLATNVMAGVYLEWPVAASALSATTVKVAGLPSGLKFTAKPVTSKVGSGKTAVTITNVPPNTIYGAPTSASKTDKKGNVTPSKVKVTVTTAGKSKAEYVIDLTVDPLPAWAVGEFCGLASTPEGRLGSASMSVTAAGKVSGKVIVNGTNVSFSVASYDITSKTVGETNLVAVVTGKLGKEAVTGGIAVVASGATGAFAGAEMSLCRNVWKDKGAEPVPEDAQGLYTVKLGADERGTGYLSLTVDKKGAVKVAGKAPDGTALSGSATLMPNGDGAYFTDLFCTPSAYKGGYVAGRLGWDADGKVSSDGLDWTSFNPQATADYYAGGFDRGLSASGARYVKTDAPKSLGVADVRLATPEGAELKTFSITQSTGVWKGTLLWDFGDPALDSVKVPFEGVMVRGEALEGFGTYDVPASYVPYDKKGQPQAAKSYKVKESLPVRFARE